MAPDRHLDRVSNTLKLPLLSPLSTPNWSLDKLLTPTRGWAELEVEGDGGLVGLWLMLVVVCGAGTRVLSTPCRGLTLRLESSSLLALSTERFSSGKKTMQEKDGPKSRSTLSTTHQVHQILITPPPPPPPLSEPTSLPGKLAVQSSCQLN